MKLREQYCVIAALYRGHPVSQDCFLDDPQAGKPGPQRQIVNCRPRWFVVGQFVVAMKPVTLGNIRRAEPAAINGAFVLPTEILKRAQRKL
jgi:hypothetical protein